MLPPQIPAPIPSGPPLDHAALYRDAAMRMRPAAEILRPVPSGASTELGVKLR